jgi:tryptophan-rich sensory protein
MMSCTADQSATSPTWSAALFALVPLIVGFIPPGFVFALDSNAASSLGLSAVSIPAWVFIGVWVVAYPCMGLAAWTIWRSRINTDACIPIAMLIACFLITLSFWLSNSLRMTATLDAISLVLAWTMVWVFSKYARSAALYLLPWAIWMPVTLAFKLIALSQGLT